MARAGYIAAATENNVAEVALPTAETSRARPFSQEWGEAYLDIYPESRTHLPHAVKTPSGAFQDIYDAWAGELGYEPALVRAPVSIVRGEWDGMCTEDDAKWLFNALKSSPIRRAVTISRGTHLMHLEESRYALYRETEAFLVGNDTVAARYPQGA